MTTRHCKSCNKELDQQNDPTSMDCGGDCLECMASAGDPDCQASMYTILKARLDKHTEATKVLEGFWAGSHWKGVTRNEARDIERAFATLNGTPFAEPKQVDPRLVEALKRKGVALYDCPFTPFHPGEEDFPIIQKIREAERETGLKFEHPNE